MQEALILAASILSIVASTVVQERKAELALAAAAVGEAAGARRPAFHRYR